MALDLERDGEAVAEVEDARVLARPLQHARAGARQPPQEERRVLVAAVLRPEEREDRELEVVRLPPEQREDPVVLPVRQAELAMERLFHDGAQMGHRNRAPGRALRFAKCLWNRPANWRRMTRRDLGLLLLLSAIWGSSFLFIKLGVDELEPSVVVLGRTVVGVAILVPLLAGRGWFAPLRGAWLPLVVLGLINNVLPFWLLAFAETRHRLGADRRDPGGGADLHGAHRDPARSRAGCPGAAARRGRRRLRRRRAARRRAARLGGGRRRRRARDRALLRGVRPLCGTDRPSAAPAPGLDRPARERGAC